MEKKQEILEKKYKIVKISRKYNGFQAWLFFYMKFDDMFLVS